MGKYSKLQIIDNIAANLQNNTTAPSGASAGDIALINHILHVYNGIKWIPVGNFEDVVTISSDPAKPAMFQNIASAFNAGYRRFILVGDTVEPASTSITSSDPVFITGINGQKTWDINGNTYSLQDLTMYNIILGNTVGQITQMAKALFDNCVIGTELVKNPPFMIRLDIRNSDIAAKLTGFDSVARHVFIDNCKFNLTAFASYDLVGTIANSSIFLLSQTINILNETKITNSNIVPAATGSPSITINISNSDSILSNINIAPQFTVNVNVSGLRNIVSGLLFDDTPPNTQQIINIQSGAKYNKVTFCHGFNINDNSGNTTNTIFGNTIYTP